MIKGYRGDLATRGCNAWMTIVRDATGTASQHHGGLVARIFSPKRVSKYSDIERAIAVWESMLREYQTLCGPGYVVEDRAKIHAVQKIVPSELDQNIKRLNAFETYDSLKNYIAEQVAQRKESVFAGASSNSDSVLNSLQNKVEPGASALKTCQESLEADGMTEHTHGTHRCCTPSGSQPYDDAGVGNCCVEARAYTPGSLHQ